MTYTFSERSEAALEGVHPALQAVVRRAIQITEIDFGVTEGMRTYERQQELLDSGASSTMNSRHLTGHAVDLVAFIGSEVRWDWPLYHKLAAAMKTASDEMDVPISWGGDWHKFQDGPHFQLTWADYPA